MNISTRQLSVSIPADSGANYYRKPTMREILSNKAPPPWTLTALIAYLSNNHCLEVLEFTMDAGRYKKHYVRMMHKAMETSAPPLAQDVENTRVLWQRLVEAYIMPSGSREINIPSGVRDPLLNVDLSVGPPAPDILDRAIAKVYELMEDSVLVPFLESLAPDGTAKYQAHEAAEQRRASMSVPASATESPNRDSYGGRLSRYSARSSWLSSNPRSSVMSTATTSTSSSKRSPPETRSAIFSRHRFSTYSAASAAPSSAVPHTPHISDMNGYSDSMAGMPGLSDDSTENNSLYGDSPMTPSICSSPVGILRHSGSSANWKRLGRWSGWRNSDSGTKQHRFSQDCREQSLPL